MAKSKKSNSEKATKDKDLKSLKPEKSGKDKKTRKKESAPEIAVEKKAKVVASKPEKPAKAPKPKTASQPKVAVIFTIEELSLRAYFIAERRQAMGWPGDSTSDWVEAERQLKAEALKKAKR